MNDTTEVLITQRACCVSAETKRRQRRRSVLKTETVSGGAAARVAAQQIQCILALRETGSGTFPEAAMVGCRRSTRDGQACQCGLRSVEFTDSNARDRESIDGMLGGTGAVSLSQLPKWRKSFI